MKFADAVFDLPFFSEYDIIEKNERKQDNE